MEKKAAKSSEGYGKKYHKTLSKMVKKQGRN